MIENQSQETQGITKESMEKQEENKEAIQRITSGALIQTGLRAQTTITRGFD